MLVGRALTVLSLVAVLISGLPSSAQDSKLSRAALKGLVGVRVIVEGFDEVRKRAGFDQSTFRTDVESQLRMAGIEVLSEKAMLDAPGMRCLYVNVNAVHQRRNEIAACSMDLELSQMALLTRDPAILCPAATWSSGSAGQGDIPDIRESVKELTDQFIKAWLSVNKRKLRPAENKSDRNLPKWRGRRHRPPGTVTPTPKRRS